MTIYELVLYSYINYKNSYICLYIILNEIIKLSAITKYHIKYL